MTHWQRRSSLSLTSCPLLQMPPPVQLAVWVLLLLSNILVMALLLCSPTGIIPSLTVLLMLTRYGPHRSKFTPPTLMRDAVAILVMVVMAVLAVLAVTDMVTADMVMAPVEALEEVAMRQVLVDG